MRCLHSIFLVAFLAISVLAPTKSEALNMAVLMAREYQKPDLASKEAELIRARIAYLDARVRLETLKALKGKDRLAALYVATEYPFDPLKPMRDGFLAARTSLADAVPAEVEGESAAIKTARKRVTDANAIPTEQATDEALATDAYKNLAAAIPDALVEVKKTPSAEAPADKILAYVRKAEAGEATLAKLATLADRLQAVDPNLKQSVAVARLEVAGWSSTISTDQQAALALLTEDQKQLKDTLAGLDKPNQPAEEQAKLVAQLSALVPEARRHREFAVLASGALQSAGAPFTKPADLHALGKALKVGADAVRPHLELAEDRLGGDRDNWRQAAIPIYYFGSVPRLMAALNLDSERYESSYFRDIDSGRKALLDAEKLRDLSRAEANRLVSELALAQQKIAAIDLRSRLNQTNAGRLGSEVERLDKAIAATPAGAKKTALEADRKAANDQKTTFDLAVATDGEEATRLRNERTELEASVGKAATDLAAARKTLNDLRLSLSALAEDEVKAFRERVQRAPFWVSRARAASKDPVKRCEIFGYEDSLIVFVRGEERDLTMVRDIIRSFDRPTPQARLTLHTLQFNGTNPNDMRGAAVAIERATTELRGNLAMIQDVLRNAISKEVNRRATIAEDAIDLPTGSSFPGRIYRGFYYPREIREELGLRLRHKDDDINNLCTVRNDFLTIRSFVALAAGRLRGVEELTDGSARKKLMAEIESAFSHAEYLFAKAEFNQPAVVAIIAAKKPDDLSALQQSAAELRDIYRKEFGLKEAAAKLAKVIGMKPVGENPYLKLVGHLESIDLFLETEINTRNKPLKQLNPDAVARIEFLTRYTLPDPAKGTTLGELLFIFSLGGQDSRERILHDFSSELLDLVRGAEPELTTKEFENFLERVTEYFDGNARALTGADRGRPIGVAGLAVACARVYGNVSENVLDVRTKGLFPYFPRTVFGGFSPRTNGGPTSEPMTANQLEVLSAIRARVRTGIAAELKARIQGEDSDPAEAAVLAEYLAGRPFKVGKGASSVDTYESTLVTSSIGATNQTLEQKRFDLGRLDQSTSWSVVSAASDESAGRIAAADDMIKRFITVLEDDLEHFLIAPTKDAMRTAVSGRNVKFGSFQSTSLLASNRTAARFDASAIATLGQDPEAAGKALQVGQQLGDLTNVISGLVGNSAGGVAPFALPLIRSTTNPETRADQFWKLGGIGLLASALFLPDTHPKAAALYSLTSGGKFRVTPVLDPSGQALRFDLDYSLTTRVQEPTNTGSLELPLVERQSMNIPIQVSNLDFRQAAGFESNTKIGITPQYFGGIPFFKQLPLLKDIPLIGYFSRSPGTPAVRQQTYVFVQSSIYPTVSDIVGLLVDSPLRLPKPAPPVKKTEQADRG